MLSGVCVTVVVCDDTSALVTLQLEQRTYLKKTLGFLGRHDVERIQVQIHFYSFIHIGKYRKYRLLTNRPTTII